VQAASVGTEGGRCDGPIPVLGTVERGASPVWSERRPTLILPPNVSLSARGGWWRRRGPRSWFGRYASQRFVVVRRYTTKSCRLRSSSNDPGGATHRLLLSRPGCRLLSGAALGPPPVPRQLFAMSQALGRSLNTGTSSFEPCLEPELDAVGDGMNLEVVTLKFAERRSQVPQDSPSHVVRADRSRSAIATSSTRSPSTPTSTSSPAWTQPPPTGSTSSCSVRKGWGAGRRSAIRGAEVEVTPMRWTLSRTSLAQAVRSRNCSYFHASPSRSG
jgi:hypothetical protein